MLRLMFLGDVVGEPGRVAVSHHVAGLKHEYDCDVVVVNGENAAGGRGISVKIAKTLLDSGVDVVTLGDHCWNQPELQHWIDHEPRVLRPLNYPDSTPGKGFVQLQTKQGPLVVCCSMGHTFMHTHLANAFNQLDAQVNTWREQGTLQIFVDFHAEASSEKESMGWLLDGRVSAVVGTHTHVQTADERILPGGTAFLSDVGMCGPHNSVLGREWQASVRRFVTSMPTKLPIGDWPVRLCGCVISIDEQGKAHAIERFCKIVEKPN